MAMRCAASAKRNWEISEGLYVAADAPSTVINEVNVSGGGSAKADASDITTITGMEQEPNWVLKSPEVSPTPRYEQAMAQVVLFGGGGCYLVCDDTWVWDGANWMVCAFTLSAPGSNIPSEAPGDWNSDGKDEGRSLQGRFVVAGCGRQRDLGRRHDG